MGADLLVFVEIRLLRTAMDVFEEFKRAVVECCRRCSSATWSPATSTT
jgi:hypothetical protein